MENLEYYNIKKACPQHLQNRTKKLIFKLLYALIILVKIITFII